MQGRRPNIKAEPKVTFQSLLDKPYWDLSRDEAAYMLYCVRRARDDFAYFCMLCYNGYQYPNHIQHLHRVLSAIEHTPDARYMVTIPPRYGKSLTVSQLFPAWYLGRNPNKNIITASYTAGLTSRFAAATRAIMQSHAYNLIFPHIKLAGRARANWGIVGYRGGLYATGVTSSITGFGADCLLIDDPIRDAMYADSASWRDNIWEWYTNTAYTRLHPGAPVFVISTRWHYDDLSGRLKNAAQADPEADQWSEVFFPALLPNGQPLWPERYNLKALMRIKASVGSRTWNALYQGNPTPEEGAAFKRWMFRKILPRIPGNVKIKWVRYWDKAGSDGAGDWTVGILLGRDQEGRFYMADLVRGQWSALEREQIIHATAEMDRNLYGRVLVAVEQEPGSGGLESYQATARRLAGYHVKADRPSGTLVLRSDPLLTQLEAGNMYFIRATWIETLIEECVQFPLGAHDDQVASWSGAFKMLTAVIPFQFATV